MVFCTKCGTANADDAMFCSKCGTQTAAGKQQTVASTMPTQQSPPQQYSPTQQYQYPPQQYPPQQYPPQQYPPQQYPPQQYPPQPQQYPPQQYPPQQQQYPPQQPYGMQPQPGQPQQQQQAPAPKKAYESRGPLTPYQLGRSEPVSQRLMIGVYIGIGLTGLGCVLTAFGNDCTDCNGWWWILVCALMGSVCVGIYGKTGKKPFLIIATLLVLHIPPIFMVAADANNPDDDYFEGEEKIVWGGLFVVLGTWICFLAIAPYKQLIDTTKRMFTTVFDWLALLSLVLNLAGWASFWGAAGDDVNGWIGASYPANIAFIDGWMFVIAFWCGLREVRAICLLWFAFVQVDFMNWQLLDSNTWDKKFLNGGILCWIGHWMFLIVLATGVPDGHSTVSGVVNSPGGHASFRLGAIIDNLDACINALTNRFKAQMAQQGPRLGLIVIGALAIVAIVGAGLVDAEEIGYWKDHVSWQAASAVFAILFLGVAIVFDGDVRTVFLLMATGILMSTTTKEGGCVAVCASLFNRGFVAQFRQMIYVIDSDQDFYGYPTSIDYSPYENASAGFALQTVAVWFAFVAYAYSVGIGSTRKPDTTLPGTSLARVAIALQMCALCLAWYVVEDNDSQPWMLDALDSSIAMGLTLVFFAVVFFLNLGTDFGVAVFFWIGIIFVKTGLEMEAFSEGFESYAFESPMVDYYLPLEISLAVSWVAQGVMLKVMYDRLVLGSSGSSYGTYGDSNYSSSNSSATGSGSGAYNDGLNTNDKPPSGANEEAPPSYAGAR